MSRPIAVDSPPGMTSPSSPSSCSGLRPSTPSAPSRRSVAACSRKLPWTARTPTFTGPILRSGLFPLAAAEQQAEQREEEAEADEGERELPALLAGIEEVADPGALSRR